MKKGVFGQVWPQSVEEVNFFSKSRVSVNVRVRVRVWVKVTVVAFQGLKLVSTFDEPDGVTERLGK